MGALSSEGKRTNCTLDGLAAQNVDQCLLVENRHPTAGIPGETLINSEEKYLDPQLTICRTEGFHSWGAAHIFEATNASASRKAIRGSYRVDVSSTFIDIANGTLFGENPMARSMLEGN